MVTKDFIPECYIDTNLIETLLQANGVYIKGVNHQKGCNNVVRLMLKKRTSDFALGIVDADKKQHSYAKEFKTLASYKHVELLKHPLNNHFLVKIHPAMEMFILSSAAEAGVQMSEYNLPSDLNDLKELTKDIDSKKNNNFKRLFKKIRDVRELSIISDILKYLYEHRYDHDIEQLRMMFADQEGEN